MNQVYFFFLGVVADFQGKNQSCLDKNGVVLFLFFFFFLGLI